MRRGQLITRFGRHSPRFSARIAERVGARLLVTGGLVVMTAGLVALAAVPAAAPVRLLAALMVLVGPGGRW